MANTEQVLKWTADKVSDWLVEKGFSKYSNVFKEHKIDGKALLLINEADLKSAPISINVSSF